MELPGHRIRVLAVMVLAALTVCSFGLPAAAAQSVLSAAETDVAAVGAVSVQTSAEETVHLYFADRQSRFLRAEGRVFAPPADSLAFGRAILNMLIRGPLGDLERTLPAHTVVRAFFIDGSTAVVDFTDTIREQHPGGCRTEMVTVFSIVNSLVLNMDGIDSVRILIDGREPDTLAGHIDLHPAYAADMLLVR